MTTRRHERTGQLEPLARSEAPETSSDRRHDHRGPGRDDDRHARASRRAKGEVPDRAIRPFTIDLKNVRFAARRRTTSFVQTSTARRPALVEGQGQAPTEEQDFEDYVVRRVRSTTTTWPIVERTPTSSTTSAGRSSSTYDSYLAKPRTSPPHAPVPRARASPRSSTRRWRPTTGRRAGDRLRGPGEQGLRPDARQRIHPMPANEPATDFRHAPPDAVAAFAKSVLRWLQRCLPPK